MVLGQSVLKRAGLRVVDTGPIACAAKNMCSLLARLAGFPFLFHIKKASAFVISYCASLHAGIAMLLSSVIS